MGDRPDSSLVVRLLDALDVSYDATRLNDAVQRVAPARVESHWLRQVLSAADVKDVATLWLPWQRFDPRRLPALIRHRDAWYFATRGEADQLELTASDGQHSTVEPVALDGAQVLWVGLRAPASRDAAPPLAGNLAARLVWTELFRERGWLWQVLVATALVNVVALSTSLFAMQVYDRVVPTMGYATLTTLVAGMVIVIALDWTLKLIRARIVDSLSCAVDRNVSQRVFEHLLRVRLDVQPRSLGTLAAQVGSLDAVRRFFSSTIVFALVDLPFALLFLAFIAVIGGAVAWVYVLLLPLALSLGWLAQWRNRGLVRAQLSRSNERQGLLVDTIRGAESIRANSAGWRFAREWQDVTESIDRYAIEQRAIGSFSTVTTGSLSILAYVSAIVVGVWQIEAGLLTMGGLIACTILGGRIIAPVAQSVQYLEHWQHVTQALSLVHQLLALEPERRDDQPLLLTDEEPTAVALESVRFCYAGSPVCQLDVADLQLDAGDRVLLAGPVGSGKSTLLKILAGIYRPSEGRVRLGQADLWQLDPLLIAENIGYLPQSVHLFRGTLRSNICLSGTVGDDRLLDVSQRLGIDEIAAAAPQGMDLPISEGGEGLSGGQRQLVALARVFARQPRIWLLDEPTTSLSREAEERVWQALEGMLRPSDILVVTTHRPLLASRLINRVLIMQQGRIVRGGRPEALLPQIAGQVGRPPTQIGKIDVV